MSELKPCPFSNRVRKYHSVVLARCGSFVGLYREINGEMKLWRAINCETYGRHPIKKRRIKQEWGIGGHMGISGEWECNEMHKIPMQYNLNKKSHLQYLDGLLGGCHRAVMEKINNAEPPRREQGGSRWKIRK